MGFAYLFLSPNPKNYPYMNPEDEVFKNFLVEMGEKLEELEESLSELEQGYSSEVMNKLFRAVHTIKGGGGFFGLTKVSELSHAFLKTCS